MSNIKNNIIVSISSHLSNEENEKFIEQIHKTIGVSHSVLLQINHNEYSLSEIYNKTLESAQINDIVVFCHPDIIIKTEKWGKKLINHFNYSEFGVLGVAGTTYLAETGKWWERPDNMFGIVEHTKNDTSWVSTYSKPIVGIQEVVLVDGVFIAVNPDKIKHPFDSKYGKFHFYDVGFCVPNYLDGVNIGVITDIRLLHKSTGEINEDWEINRINFVANYKDELPIFIDPDYKDFYIKLTIEPKITVIIPTKNNLQILVDNIKSWDEVVKYGNYEIVIADTGSDPVVLNQYEKFIEDRNNIRLVKYDYYNFAKINNDVVKNHVSEDTELILFCNDDIVLLNDALTRCVQIYNNNKNVGTIGIRLHYEDATIQHCGIMMFTDENGKLYITHKDLRRAKEYSTGILYNSIGNSASFLLINKNLFIELGYFNEIYRECFEDVELNLKCLVMNKKNITVCDAVGYHYESISRNKNEGKFERQKLDYNRGIIPYYEEHKDKIKKYIPKINSKTLQSVQG